MKGNYEGDYIMGKVVRVGDYLRHTKKGVVKVSGYNRTDNRRRINADPQKLLERVFGYEGEPLLHMVSADYVSLDDKIGAAVLLGMSSDEGFGNIVSKKKTIPGRMLIRKADMFIAKYADAPCKGLFTGVPMDAKAFKGLIDGKYVDLSKNLPFYATPVMSKALGFARYTSRKDIVPCVFEVVGGNAYGNRGHRSKHEDEQEVTFKSTTKVKVVGTPQRKQAGMLGEHYVVQCQFEDK